LPGRRLRTRVPGSHSFPRRLLRTLAHVSYLQSLRHTFATVAVETGIPEEVVGRLLNHVSKTITGQRYVKPKLDFLRAAMEEIVAELERRLAG